VGSELILSSDTSLRESACATFSEVANLIQSVFLPLDKSMIDISQFSAFVGEMLLRKELEEIAQSPKFDIFVTNEHGLKDRFVALVTLEKRSIKSWIERNDIRGRVIDSMTRGLDGASYIKSEPRHCRKSLHGERRHGW